MRTNLIVGAGFTGAVIAERIASVLGEKVIVIDQRDHIGGNAHDCLDEHGVLIHRYGPHIFHTNSSRIVEYLSRFTQWQPYEHRVLGLVAGKWVPLPFNLTSMELVFGEAEGQRLNGLLIGEFGEGERVPILKMRQSASADVRRVAEFIYENVFLHYTAKQWGMRPEELDPSVSARVPVLLSRDDRYFQDSFQAMPCKGFTEMFRRMLDHPLIEVRLGQNFREVEASGQFDRIVYTGPIDEFFGYVHGALPYRSIRFDMRSEPAAAPVQRATVENYPTPSGMHPFTRSTEFRLLTGQDNIGYTTRAFEFSEAYEPGLNEPYYPVPRDDNQELFRRYAAEAEKLATVHFAGRLADYSYYNMDQAVGRALACFEKEIVPGKGAASA